MLVLALACVEWPVYSHEPTTRLDATLDLDAPELVPFTHDGVTVGVSVVSGQAVVTLLFASKQAATVTVETVRIEGSTTVDVEPRQDVALVEHARRPGFYSVRHWLRFTAPDTGIDAMAEGGLTVTVTWRVGAGEATTTELSIQRRIARDIAWPT